MRFLKSHPLLKIINSYIIDSPQPTNLSYLWNFGSLLGVCLVIQIITGVTLAMHYNPSVLEAFNSVEHIMRDVNNGWLIRYLHSNTASAFFFIVYLHIGKGLYYGSYRTPRTLVWVIGVIIFLLMIITGFLGFLTIAQNGLNTKKQQQQNQQQKQQHTNIIPKPYPYIEYNLESSFISVTLILNAIRTIILVLVLRLLIVISLALDEERKEDFFEKLNTFFRPSEENQESFYLEELFREKPSTESEKIKPDFSTDSKNKYNHKGRRHYSTSRNCSNSKILTEFILNKNLQPIYVYEDLGESFTKKNILEDTRGLSGIYLILNKVTLDYYIGSASTNRIHKRFSSHLVNFTGSKVIKNAVRKYKISEFAFLVIEIFPEIVTQENNKKLLNLEDFYLKSLLPNYNILTEAGSTFGYKHSELTRIRMKTSYSQERRDKIGSLNKNKKFSDATIELMREKALNRIKPVYSEQSLENMKKTSKPIIVYNLDQTVYGKYPSVVLTARNLNCSVKTVHRALKSESKLLKKNWIVDYV